MVIENVTSGADYISNYQVPTYSFDQAIASLDNRVTPAQETIAGLPGGVVDLIRNMGGHRLAMDGEVKNFLNGNTRLIGIVQNPEDDSFRYVDIPQGQSVGRLDAVLLEVDGKLVAGARVPSFPGTSNVWGVPRSEFTVPKYEVVLTSGGYAMYSTNPQGKSAIDFARLAGIPASALFIEIDQFFKINPFFKLSQSPKSFDDILLNPPPNMADIGGIEFSERIREYQVQLMVNDLLNSGVDARSLLKNATNVIVRPTNSSNENIRSNAFAVINALNINNAGGLINDDPRMVITQFVYTENIGIGPFDGDIRQMKWNSQYSDYVNLSGASTIYDQMRLKIVRLKSIAIDLSIGDPDRKAAKEKYDNFITQLAMYQVKTGLNMDFGSSDLAEALTKSRAEPGMTLIEPRADKEKILVYLKQDNLKQVITSYGRSVPTKPFESVVQAFWRVVMDEGPAADLDTEIAEAIAGGASKAEILAALSTDMVNGESLNFSLDEGPPAAIFSSDDERNGANSMPPIGGDIIKLIRATLVGAGLESGFDALKDNSLGGLPADQVLNLALLNAAYSLTPEQAIMLATLDKPPADNVLAWAISQIQQGGDRATNAERFMASLGTTLLAEAAGGKPMPLPVAMYLPTQTLFSALNNGSAGDAASVAFAGSSFNALPKGYRQQFVNDGTAYDAVRAGLGKPPATESQGLAFRDAYLAIRAADGTTTEAYNAGKTAAEALDKPLDFANPVISLASSTTTERARVADLVPAYTTKGTPAYTLSGTDAAKFEVIEGKLYIKSGVDLASVTTPKLNVTVTVSYPDAAVPVLAASAPFEVAIRQAFQPGSLAPNDDSSSRYINISNVFEDGIRIGGTTYTGMYVNNNGNITFNSSLGTFTPKGIGSVTQPIIAAFWADVDTRDAGTLTWSADAATDSITIRWTDVGYFNLYSDKQNTFSITLTDKGQGNFDVTFDYDAINWTTGNASDGRSGLGGIVARAGISNGIGSVVELSASGNQAAMLALEQSNGGGVYKFSVVNGVITLNTSQPPPAS